MINLHNELMALVERARSEVWKGGRHCRYCQYRKRIQYVDESIEECTVTLLPEMCPEVSRQLRRIQNNIQYMSLSDGYEGF